MEIINSVHEIRVSAKRPEDDILAKSTAAMVARVCGLPPFVMSTEQVYYVQGVSETGAVRLARRLFREPVSERFTLNRTPDHRQANILEVAYRPVVTDPRQESVMKAARYLGVNPEAIMMSTCYHFPDWMNEEQLLGAHSLLMNLIVHDPVHERPTELRPRVDYYNVTHNIRHMIDATDEQVAEVAKHKPHSSYEELIAKRDYFRDVQGRDPTDVEDEIIEAWWSEHCWHKTFKRPIEAGGVIKPPLFQRIVDISLALTDEDDLSAFIDNSGVIRLYDGWAICAKVETHNFPSTIEPYGGANTGSGGVFRDPAGTGKGSRVNISTDMFCFGPPDLPLDQLPQGCHHPEYLLRRVVDGVRDYGNPVGIPTINGSVTFDHGFRARPVVIVGAYGILPEDKAQKGKPVPGDLVVAIGGRTGRDGLHGATGSSRLITFHSTIQDASAVQIGNPIEEKRVLDAIVECRDNELIEAITDCGAAGFSSAVGEMGKETGVWIDLARAPVKYHGLSAWEKMMSESQERMVVAVKPENFDEFLRICRRYNVEATALGHFTDTHKFQVIDGQWQGQPNLVADLDYDFLEHGLKLTPKSAKWEKPNIAEVVPDEPNNYLDLVKKVLSHWSVASKEPIVRQYDHGVQGTGYTFPYENEGPNDGAVIAPVLGKPYGQLVSHGMNPSMMEIDPREGTFWAVAEAMANYIAIGGHPKKGTRWINNYIWPIMDEKTLGSLDRCVDAVCDAMKALGVGVKSGKDSLSSTYLDQEGNRIDIPPVLCMSVFGKIPDVSKIVTAGFKKAGSTICLVGQLDSGMGGTIYYKVAGGSSGRIPTVDMELLPRVLDKVHQAIQTGEVLACHDNSEGGIVNTIFEMGVGANMGAQFTLPEGVRPDTFLFNETAGTFVIEIESPEKAEALFAEVPFTVLGKTTNDANLAVTVGNQELFSASMEELKQVWQEPLRRIFN